MTSQGQRRKRLPKQNLSVSMFIAIFNGKAFVVITVTMTFKGCTLLKEASFYCDGDQIWLGKGDHQVPLWQLPDGCWEAWLVCAGLGESMLLLGQKLRNHLNIWGCELTQWEGIGLLSWGWHTHVFPFSKVLSPQKSHWSYKSVKPKFLCQRFCFNFFHNLSLSDLIVCSTHLVTEAFTASFICDRSLVHLGSSWKNKILFFLLPVSRLELKLPSAEKMCKDCSAVLSGIVRKGWLAGISYNTVVLHIQHWPWSPTSAQGFFCYFQ